MRMPRWMCVVPNLDRTTQLKNAGDNEIGEKFQRKSGKYVEVGSGM